MATLAQWADLLAAAGVILSLIFVGVQIRAARIEARFANTRAGIEVVRDFKSLTNDPVLADLVLRGRADIETLTPAERFAFANYLEQGLMAAIVIYNHRGRGVLPTEVSLRLVHRHFRTIMDHPGPRAHWMANREALAMADYIKREVDLALGFPPGNYDA